MATTQSGEVRAGTAFGYQGASVETAMVVASRGTIRGDLTHPFEHRVPGGENASTLTRVPLDALLRVESATTITVLSFFGDVSVTDLRTARGAYWSTVRTLRPFTNTATLPLRGPATYHSANRLPLTL